jgi:ABC-type phosphate transport system permease subunit
LQNLTIAKLREVYMGAIRNWEAVMSKVIKAWKERIMEGVFLIAALTSIESVFLICLFLFVNGVPGMGKIGFFNFLLGRNGHRQIILRVSVFFR